ncbi:MAG: hypothetical protein KA784_00180 [Aquabacterium sp.]|nr:hypothetical protein [Aquabacterium sp.]
MTEANTTKQTTPADRLVIMRVGALHRALELMINQAIRSASNHRHGTARLRPAPSVLRILHAHPGAAWPSSQVRRGPVLRQARRGV